MDLHGRSLLKETDLSRDEFLHLLTLAFQVREEKRLGCEFNRLARRNIALIFEKASTRTRSAFEVAAHDEGAHVTYLGPGDSHLGIRESVKDGAGFSGARLMASSTAAPRRRRPRYSAGTREYLSGTG